MDRNLLVNNKSLVLGGMNATKRKLRKDTVWEEVYEKQLKELIDRGFAKEIKELELDKRRG